MSSSQKAFFTPNFSRGGCTFRPYVHSAHALAAPAPKPAVHPFPDFHSKEFKREARRAWAGAIVKLSFIGVGLAMTFLAAPIIYCDRM